MANKRVFKKSLEALSSAIASEMLASYYNVESADKEKISQAIAMLASAMETTSKNTAKLFEKKVKDFENAAAYYKAKSEFTKQKYDSAIANYNDTLAKALSLYNEGMLKNKVEIK